MGCAPSQPVASFNQFETHRKGLPGRVEIPAEDVQGAWLCGTLGRALEVDGGYQVRIDNGGPTLNVVLKRPAAMMEFSNFTDEGYGDEYDEDAYEAFQKSIPQRLADPIEVIVLAAGGGKKRLVRGRVGAIRQYEGGERVLVLMSNVLTDATIAGPAVNAGAGNAYDLRVGGEKNEPAAKPGKEKLTRMDLNDFNHCVQRFACVEDYQRERRTYLKEVGDQLSMISDSITGNEIALTRDQVYITLESTGANSVDSKAGGSWKSMRTMEDLAEAMLSASPERSQGVHESHGVLVRAGPGTGKTVSLQQLTRLLAMRLLDNAPADAAAAPGAAPPGVELVPMLVSVQRMATYMNQASSAFASDGGDLLRAYIIAQYTGARRDLLLMAYEIRALVCCIDGVDEAAGLKGKIEDLVIDRLMPMGVRIVVSSRPEGVRLERYHTFHVKDLKPLTLEQQRMMVTLQLKGETETKIFESLMALLKLRKQLQLSVEPSEVTAQTSAQGAAHTAVLGGLLPNNEDPTDLARVLEFFEEASIVPVLLSMMVVVLQRDGGPGAKARVALPTSRLELYKAAARALVTDSVTKATGSQADLGLAHQMLATIAVTNHLAQRREFTSVDVVNALSGETAMVKLWETLEEQPSGVPLVKTLEVGTKDGTLAAQRQSKSGSTNAAESTATKYQFKHLSFQEAFFAEALTFSDAAADPLCFPKGLITAAHTIWERGALRALNDRWLLNTFVICGGALARTVGERIGTSLVELHLTDQQVKACIALQWGLLQNLKSLTRITMRCNEGTETSAASVEAPSSDKPRGGRRYSAVTLEGSRERASFEPLARMLREKSELGSLTAIDVGVPASIGAAAAAAVAVAASQHRKNFALCPAVSAAHTDRMNDADAILIAGTLRSALGTSGGAALDAAVIERCVMVTGDDESRYIGVAPKPPDGTTAATGASSVQSLASVLRAAGVQASAFPRENASHAKISGFAASELRAKLSLAELMELGYKAYELANSTGGPPAPPTAAVLRELVDLGLGIELVGTATSAVVPVAQPSPQLAMLEELRKAQCSSVPSDEHVEEAFEKCYPALTAGKFKGLKSLDIGRQGIDDADGATIIWALAMYSDSELVDLSLSRNNLGAKTALALSHFLRYNRTVTTIDLHDNSLDDNAVGALSRAFAHNPVVETVRLSDNKLTPAGAATVVNGLIRNVSLRSITMETSGGAATTGIPLLPLKGALPAYTLDLNSLRLGPLSMEIICRLVAMYRPEISTLHVDQNPLKPEGMSPLAEMLKSNDDIKVLSLRYCALGAQGAVTLSAALKVNTSVETCILVGNQIGDDGADAIISLMQNTASLRRLDVQDNQLSPQKKTAIKEAASKCKSLEHFAA